MAPLTSQSGSGAGSRVARNSLIMLGQQAFVALATIVVAGVVARHLGKEDFGLYEYAFSLVAMFSVVATLGLRAVTIRSVAQLDGPVGDYVGMMLVLRLSLALLVLPAVLATAWLLHDRQQVVVVVALAALTLPFNAVSTLLRDLFQGMERMDVEAATQIAVRVFTLIGAVSAVALGGSVVAIVAVYAAGALVALIVPAIAIKRNAIRIRPRLALDASLDQLRQGLPFFGTAAVALTVWEVNPLLLSELSTLAMVGIYAAGTRLIGPLEMIPDSVATALLPTVARGHRERSAEVQPLLQRVFFVLVLMGLPVGVGGVLCARSVVDLVFGSEYASAAGVLQLAVAAVPMEFITIPAVYVLGAIHQQTSVFVLTLVAGAVNIGINLWLIPRYGALGCAWSIFAVAAVSFVLVLLLLRRHYAVWSGGQPYARLLLATGIMAAAVYPLRQRNALLAIAVGAAVYGAAVLVLRIVRPRELRHIMRGELTREDSG